MSDSNNKQQITILNWDQYQSELKGDGVRRRRRSWVSISVDLFSDPDFFKMDLLHRTAWVGLLCHAGKVGPVFELCASDARVMFQLRRSPDFEVFKNQGFIDLQSTTRKEGRKDTRKKVKPAVANAPPVYPAGLNIEAWELYLQHRRELKLKKYTDRGAAAAMNNLAKYSTGQQMAAVNQSIEKNWQGLFPEKVADNGGGKKSYSQEMADGIANMENSSVPAN